MNRQVFKKLGVIILAVALMFTVTACSNDDDDGASNYYNISGQVKNSIGNGMSDVTVKFSGNYDPVTTNEDGVWTLKNVKGGSTVTVTPQDKNGYTFESKEVPVTGDATNINFTGVAPDTYYQGYVTTIDYVEGETVITLQFDGDIRPVSNENNLKAAINIEGLSEGADFTVNLIENETGTDGNDSNNDYLEDKDLLIRINDRIASTLRVMIAPNTFVKYDKDGEAGKKIGKIVTKDLALNDNTNLKAKKDVIEFSHINTIKNAEQVVVVNLTVDKSVLPDEMVRRLEFRMPKVKELFKELTAESNDADIIEIAGRIEEDLNHVVREGDTIVVRAENGEIAEYNIRLADIFSNATVKSDFTNYGYEIYSVDNTVEKITSGEIELAWNTTVSELKDNLTLTSSLLEYLDNMDRLYDLYKPIYPIYKDYMKVVAVDTNITAESFESLTELSGKLGEGNDNNVAAKLVVQALNGNIKVYDVITAEPNHTTNVAAVEDKTVEPEDDDVSYKVLDIDTRNKVVTVRSDLEEGFLYEENFVSQVLELLEGKEGATISDVTNDSFLVTAQDGHTTAEYEVKYAPGYIPSAFVDDATPYQLGIKFAELDELIEEDVDYEDLKADILEHFRVTVAGNRADVLDVDLEDKPESDVAYLRLNTKVLEGDEVTVDYTPDSTDGAYFIYDNNRTVGFAEQTVDNNVDAPNYYRMVNEVSDLDAGTGDTDKITIEFDDNVVAVGDTTQIAEDFTVQTTKDRDSSKISGDQSPDVIDVAVVNSNQVELTLNSKILATEKIEVYYEPDYTANDDVLADTDTVENTSEDKFNVKDENVVRLFAEGEGSDSTAGKSVPNNVVVPSIISAEIKDGEADNIYLEFNGDVLVSKSKVADINDWFKIEGDRKLVSITPTNDLNIIKLELEEGVNEAVGDIDVTYAPKLRTGNDVPVGFLTDNNRNKILRNEITAVNNVESASFSQAYVDDNDDDGDTTESGTTADEVIVEFDEEINVTDKTGFSVTVDGAEAAINSVDETSSSIVTLALDSKVKANQDVKVSYTADESVNNLIDADEIDPNNENNNEDVDVVTFANQEVTNNVEAPEFASATIKNNERKTIYVNFTEELDYINSPDFNIINYEDGLKASYEDEFADDNFTVMVDGYQNRVTNAELINEGSDEEYPQLKLSLTKALSDDDQEVKLSYDSDDYTNSKLHDSQENVVANFSSEVVTNELETPDFKSAVVYDDAPNVIEVMFDSQDSLDTSTVTNNSAAITINGTEVGVNNAVISGTIPNQVVKYELDTPVETGRDTVEIKVGSDLIKDSNGDTVSRFNVPIEADNQVVGPDIEGAAILDNESNKLTVTFDEPLATDGETGLDGANTTNYSSIANDFTVRVKGNENPIIGVVSGSSSNELKLILEHKVAAGIEDVDLSYVASENLADQYGNKATESYNGPVVNQVASNTKVKYTATHQTTSSTTIEVQMTNPVDIEGNSADLQMEVIDANGNRLSIASVSTYSSTVEITLDQALTADQGDLTVYYTPTVKDNLVGAGTIDKDPVAKFSAAINNTL